MDAVTVMWSMAFPPGFPKIRDSRVWRLVPEIPIGRCIANSHQNPHSPICGSENSLHRPVLI
jgi:hypothetical protein